MSVDLQVLTPRDVPLGGLRAMTVRRTLPTRERSLIGAWCFVDHYGPDDVAATGGMQVAPHPHTGLQTVSWLFEGEIEHRDSAGHHAMVRPGELNLMTAGRGISHSEVSTATTSGTLHGAQLWVALPDGARFGDPGFEHYAPAPVDLDASTVSVFLGEVGGERSPVHTATPLLGAEIRVPATADVVVPVDADFEHGVLVDSGTVRAGNATAGRGDLLYIPPGCTNLELSCDGPARLLLLGGPPFGEQIVMWWNFVGRDHDEVVEFRRQWQEQIDGDVLRDGHFGIPHEDRLPPIPAPGLPNARLRPRG